MRILTSEPSASASAESPRGERPGCAPSPFEEFLESTREDARKPNETKFDEEAAAAAARAAAAAPERDPETKAESGEAPARATTTATPEMAAPTARETSLLAKANDPTDANDPSDARSLGEAHDPAGPLRPAAATEAAAAFELPADVAVAAESQPSPVHRPAAKAAETKANDPAKPGAAEAPKESDAPRADATREGSASNSHTPGEANDGSADARDGRRASNGSDLRVDATATSNGADPSASASPKSELRAAAIEAPATALRAEPAPAAIPLPNFPVNLPAPGAAAASPAAIPNTTFADPTPVPASADARDPQLPPGVGAESVIRQVAVHLRGDATELRLRLDPPGLGELRLSFVYDGGRIRARVRASVGSTAELLRAHAGDLSRAMREAGIDLAELDVHEDRPGTSSRNRWLRQGNGLRQENGDSVEAAAAPRGSTSSPDPAAPAVAPQLSRRAVGRVDLFV